MPNSNLHPQLNPITEQDIADFLVNTPDFFERHAELLATVQLNSGHGKRAVSLQERQAEMLREKIKLLERSLMDMVRHGNANMQIADKLQRWSRQLLLVTQPSEMPDLLIKHIKNEFAVPQVAIKVWDVDAAYADAAFATGVSDDAKAFAASLQLPYVGINSDFEVANWLEDKTQALSVALVPLRAKYLPHASSSDGQAQSIGLLVLASPDAQRFNADMATDFLERIGETASAALSRLKDAKTDTN